MEEQIMGLIEDYGRKHGMALTIGGEYIEQNEEATCDAVQLVCKIFDLYAQNNSITRIGK